MMVAPCYILITHRTFANNLARGALACYAALFIDNALHLHC